MRNSIVRNCKEKRAVRASNIIGREAAVAEGNKIPQEIQSYYGEPGKGFYVPSPLGRRTDLE